MSFKQRYTGKVCLVTASSTGIGYSIAEHFAKEGATVLINSRNKDNVEKAVLALKNQNLKADPLIGHVGKPDDRKRMAKYIQETYGGLDVLVLNAAASTHFGTTLDTTEDQFDKMIEVNLKGAFFLIKECYPLLKGRKGSNILIISSYVGYDAEPMIGAYSITKTALFGMTKVFAKELMHDGIRVNCIAPGLIKTRFSSGIWKDREDDVVNNMKAVRLGEVQDIAKGALFICSEDADYIVGETIAISGMVTARLQIVTLSRIYCCIFFFMLLCQSTEECSVEFVCKQSQSPNYLSSATYEAFPEWEEEALDICSLI
eukprot:TRINITY_DN12070_c0_g5_i3.p1 TRINITY_DN12070_c0_g5~~TRINITY_DN12070_c0_g5_i3.p1  ORF type:complete len:316 (-),score=51.82 TRINITY_DN12070_c0_g5_i3:117-1064(-)